MTEKVGVKGGGLTGNHDYLPLLFFCVETGPLSVGALTN